MIQNVFFARKRRCAIWKIAVFLWIAGAAAADLKTDKIPNRLCLMMSANGLVFNGYIYGLQGLKDGLYGMLIPFVILFGLFAIGVIGAGDIKLLCAAGAWEGGDIRMVMIYSCAAAGILAVAKLARTGIYGKQRTTMHMTVPIACGYVVYAAGGWLHVI